MLHKSSFQIEVRRHRLLSSIRQFASGGSSCGRRPPSVSETGPRPGGPSSSASRYKNIATSSSRGRGRAIAGRRPARSSHRRAAREHLPAQARPHQAPRARAQEARRGRAPRPGNQVEQGARLRRTPRPDHRRMALGQSLREPALHRRVRQSSAPATWAGPMNSGAEPARSLYLELALFTQHRGREILGRLSGFHGYSC
jgi:hypothetical protein